MSNCKWIQIKRINRKLAKEGFERLRVSRGEQTIQNLGEYFVLDISRNVVVDFRVDLDEWEPPLRGQPAGPPSSKESELFRYAALGLEQQTLHFLQRGTHDHTDAAVDNAKASSPMP